MNSRCISKKARIASILWICAIAIAAVADVPVANAVHESGLGRAVKFWPYVKYVKLPGTFYLVLPAAIVLGAFHAWKWRATVLVAVSGMISGAFYFVIKWMVGRTRPFKPDGRPVAAFEFAPFHHGLIGLVKAENQSFPSGHACLAFAAAAAFAWLFPRAAVVFYCFALIVAGERIAENAHYLSDVVAAAGLGIVSAALTWRLFDRLIPNSRSRAAVPPSEAVE